MKIMAWNLNHKASERRLSAKLVDAIQKISPDLLILNEYVHGETRATFVEALCAIGLRHLQLSIRINSNNQVLMACRQRMELGDLAGPKMHDDGGTSNFLHIKLTDSVEIVGVRAPAYEASAHLREYWQQLRNTIEGTRDRRIAYIGDLNADPNRRGGVGDKHLAELRTEGWVIPEAIGPWSYSAGTRVDHAVLSPSFGKVSAEYVCSINGLVLAKRGDRTAISDHAALVVQVTEPVRDAVQQQTAADGAASSEHWR